MSTEVRRALYGWVLVMFYVMISSVYVSAGPVILGGDDLTEHGSVVNGVPQQGWLYMQRALENLSRQVARPGNDGSIAALGSAPSTATSDDAGAAIGVAAAAAGLRVTFYNGADAINSFFADLARGAVNPAIIWIAGTECCQSDTFNDLVSAEGTALTANAQAIADFANDGGGLLAHGFGTAAEQTIAYGWLQTLIPGLQAVLGCDFNGATLTPVGMTAFPGLSNTDITAGPCHNHFEGNLGGLEILALDGNGDSFIIGGGRGTIITGQVRLDPLTAANSVGTTHSVTATITASRPPFGPLVNVPVTFQVTAGPNAGDSGTAFTDANGIASFTYTGDSGTGIDEIRASIVDPSTGNLALSNLVQKCWGLAGDVNCNGILDPNDAQLILEEFVGLAPSAAINAVAGDVNRDGLSNNFDAVLILAVLAGLLPSLP